MTTKSFKTILVKVEVQETSEDTHKVIITPRDTGRDCIDTLDALFHAIVSTEPKRGSYLIGSSAFKVEVKLNDIIEDLNT